MAIEIEGDMFALLDSFFNMKFDDRELWLKDFNEHVINKEQRAKASFVSNSIALREHLSKVDIVDIKKDPVMIQFARFMDKKFK